MDKVPDTVKAAIREMGKYLPDARNEAKKMTQKIFNNYRKLIDVNVKEDFKYIDKEGQEQTDWTARKQYIDSSKTIAEALPTLVKTLEEGYGVVETTKKGETESKVKAIDMFHKLKKDEK
jgi:vacuolar-type H+-ATPase subunit H